MTKTLAAAAIALTATATAPAAQAQTLPYGMDAYIGGQVGYGTSRQTTPTESAAFASYQRAGIVFGGYAGIGWYPIAAEIGWLSLPQYHAYAVATDPPRSAQQTVRSDAKFARALLRAPADWLVRPYAFAGVAKVKVENHEVGDCTQCGVGFVPDYAQTITATRPYVGGGVELHLTGPFSVRGELGYIPRVTQSGEHIGPRDYYLGSLALQVRF